ncbi:MAG: branched-chain amino acid ABC transporter permease [Desulfobacterales bacterium]|nr:MAG: branched-chain amino acid ABC transporter permease [Desulfobacterales bacterium]
MPGFGSYIKHWITVEMLIAFAVLSTVPLWVEAVGLYQYLGVEILIWMIYALGFNLLLGYTGKPSFGHGAFFGIGAYGFGLSQLHLMENTWLGLGFAVLAATVAGAAVGAFVSHRRGIYFALMTIAFGQVFWFTSVKWHAVTGGEDGLQNIPRPDVFSISLWENEALYYFAFVFFCIVVVALWRLIHSPFGKVIKAIKQNEMRAGFIGYNVRLFKFLVFTISAGIAGLAGGLFSMAQGSAYPDVMSLHVSGLVVMMTLIGGGFVSFWGPVLGTIIFFVARDILGALTETWLLWYGLMFIVVVLFKPEGLAGIWQDLTRSRMSGKESVAAHPLPFLRR